MAPSATTDSSVVLSPPYGYENGNNDHKWADDEGDIVKIVVHGTPVGITGLQTTYKRGDNPSSDADLRGKFPEDSVLKLMKDYKPAEVVLDFPAEYLVLVQGTFGKLRRLVDGKETDYYSCITSLTFVTNCKSHGPYGVPTEDTFQSPPHSKVMGFSGTAGAVLDSINVLTKPYSRYIVPQEGRADKIVEISVDQKSDIISIKTSNQDNKGGSSVRVAVE